MDEIARKGNKLSHSMGSAPGVARLQTPAPESLHPQIIDSDFDSKIIDFPRVCDTQHNHLIDD